MKARLAGTAVAVLCLLAACNSRPKMDVEVYPNGGMSTLGGNIEGEEGTLFRIKQVSADGPAKVAAFFRDQLVSKGWTETQTIGYVFSDGEMTLPPLTAMDDPRAGPVDPSVSSGYILVTEADNRTYIYILRYQPKPKK